MNFNNLNWQPPISYAVDLRDGDAGFGFSKHTVVTKNKRKGGDRRMIQDRHMDIAKILNHYGRENQLLKSIEELFELIDAIRKERTADTLDNYDYDAKSEIMTEIADVLIMCEQLRLMHKISLCELDKEINYKVDRQLKRMKEKKNDN